MSDYNETLLLAKRNIEAMNEGMKFFEAQRVADKQRVEQLQETVTQMVQQIQNLTVQVAMLRVQSLGNGATT
jgi:hypothetical protein